MGGVGAVGIGFDDIGASLDIGGVDALDEVGGGEGDFVEAAINEDPFVVEDGAHGPVEDQRGLVNLVEKWRGGHGGLLPLGGEMASYCI